MSKVRRTRRKKRREGPGFRRDAGDFADACGAPYHWGYDFPDFAKSVHVGILVVVDADVSSRARLDVLDKFGA